MSGTGLLLEVVLMALLALTLFHAVRLERALGVLKRDRAVLEGLVSGFNAATRQAEAGIDRLRGAVDGAGRQVARQIDGATLLKDDLVFLIERGERLADRIDGLVRQHRVEASGAVAVRRPVDDAVAEPVPSGTSGEDAAPDVGVARVRSQAERDLLRALRMAR